MTTDHYTGSCQCGAVRFEADLDLSGAVTCNCSRCQRLGLTLVFTGKDGFSLLAGAGAQTEYRFNTETIRHLFCPVCGVESFALGTLPDGTETVAVNVNCLDGVDPRALAATHFDGASR